jgi:3-deoxy-D-manno-octulosonate 8-phosphate phosphatase (KDO 8-P phosphatase)
LIAHSELLRRAKKIKLLVSDIDGCWTDGHVTINTDGIESVTFSIHDGYGMRSLLKAGIEIAVISGRNNPAVGHRAQRLGISEIHMGELDKIPAYKNILSSRFLNPEEIAVVGDDIPDLALFQQDLALRFAPQNAVGSIKKSADYVTSASGGNGAIREICDLILNSKEL